MWQLFVGHPLLPIETLLEQGNHFVGPDAYKFIKIFIEPFIYYCRLKSLPKSPGKKSATLPVKNLPIFFLL
jgi:hypothetical protein